MEKHRTVGAAFKALRKLKGRGLRQVKCVSAPFLSEVENDKVNISLAKASEILSEYGYELVIMKKAKMR